MFFGVRNLSDGLERYLGVIRMTRSAHYNELRQNFSHREFSERGQITIAFLLMVPLIVSLFLGLGRIALVVVTKTRLQVAADHGAWHGAHGLAETLNKIGVLNWKIRDEFNTLKQEFVGGQQNSKELGEQLIRDAQNRIDGYRGEMDDLLANGYQRACERMLASVRQETPWAKARVMRAGVGVAGDRAEISTCDNHTPLFSFGDDHLRDDQWETLHYTYPTGGGDLMEPVGIGNGEGDLFRYRVKPGGDNQQVAFPVRLSLDQPDDLPPLTASAAAQPIDGDIAAFADVASEDADAVLTHAEHDGVAYHESLIALDRVQDRAAGYAGLQSQEDDWNEVDDDFLQ